MDWGGGGGGGGDEGGESTVVDSALTAGNGAMGGDGDATAVVAVSSGLDVTSGFELRSPAGQAREGDGEEGPKLASPRWGKMAHCPGECDGGWRVLSGSQKWGTSRLGKDPRFRGPGFQ